MNITPLQHVTVIYLLVIISSYFAIIAGKSYIADENELLENIQALFLFASACVFIISLPRARNSIRILMFAGFLFFISLLLREIDIEKFNLPDTLVMLGSGFGRNFILLSLWLIVIGIMLVHLSYYIEKLKQLLFSSAGALYVLGGLLLLLGEYLDTLGNTTRIFEEIVEVAGFYFMFNAALQTPGILFATGNITRTEENLAQRA